MALAGTSATPCPNAAGWLPVWHIQPMSWVFHWRQFDFLADMASGLALLSTLMCYWIRCSTNWSTWTWGARDACLQVHLQRHYEVKWDSIRIGVKLPCWNTHTRWHTVCVWRMKRHEKVNVESTSCLLMVWSPGEAGLVDASARVPQHHCDWSLKYLLTYWICILIIIFFLYT